MRFAIVTPSYGPDFEQCRLLAESVKEFVPADVEHVLLVDRRDVPQFRPLAGPRTRVVEAESFLPRWVRRMPFSRKWWLSLKTLPVRSWILQQVVKLSVAEHLDADGYVMADSDVSFVRPFDPAEFVGANGRVRLFRVPGLGTGPRYQKWHQSAAALLGLPQTNYFGANYIGNLISWRRDVLRGLYRRIEDATGRSWAAAVCSRLHLSEYILYGVFVEHVLGGRGHEFQARAHCHISWEYDLKTPAGIDKFVGDLRPEHVAVMVHSKDRVPVSNYADRLRLAATPTSA